MTTLTQTIVHASHSTAAHGHLASQSHSSHLSPPPSALSDEQGIFAFARIHNDVCLVHTNASLANPKSSLLTPVELAIFRHEFGTMFRLARRAKLPARDVQVLASLDEVSVLCDADSGVVFLAREMTNQLLRYTSPSPSRRVSNTPLRSRRTY